MFLRLMVCIGVLWTCGCIMLTADGAGTSTTTEKNASNTIITPPSNFHLDVDGMSVSISNSHICVLERVHGVDIGGRAVCFGDPYLNRGLNLKPPADVRLFSPVLFWEFSVLMFCSFADHICAAGG
jgi:hypothetical protein